MSAPAADPRAARPPAAERAEAGQREAARPDRSVWVAASAGSGKTKALTDRALRLLLAGARPERLLCLTFTRAAAAEMATRISDRLSEWAVAEEAALRDRLRELAGAAPSAEETERARRLFAEALDAPGGLRVQTIHAFCQSVLRRFPLEAGLPPQFEAMDERTAAEAMRAARDRTIRRARSGADPRLADALADVSRRVEEGGLSDLLADLLKERARLGEPGEDGREAAIRRALGVEPGATERGALARACEDGAFDGPALRACAAALGGGGTKTDRGRGAALAAWLAAGPEERAARFDGWKAVFLTAGGEIRARLATRGAVEAMPGILDILGAEARRLVELEARRRALDLAARSVSLVRLGRAVLEEYRAGKRRRRAVDYDDLILATRDLLSRPGAAAWVLYRLDGGIDHVLIDEAQDTNPEQWEIVEKLTGEFFAGAGAAEARGAADRTVFAVGDAKQSIFGFQRADPDGFLAMRAKFAERVRDARKGWSSVALDMSFRSTAPVLRAVDAAFARDGAGRGVREEGAGGALLALRHRAHRALQAGRVELWPAVEPEEEGGPDPWTAPVARRERDEPHRRLARRIADEIHGWLDTGEILESRGRPIRPGDVMVLVRRRGPFVEPLVRALKDRKIEVAGVDRMVLTDQLAAMDLAALGRFLLLPEDDLTLATVLKGPFVGFSEERLYELCRGRGGRPLWRALAGRAGENADFRGAFEKLSGWLARADYAPPHEFYAALLAEGGRRALLERLGAEAGDPIDEFLAQALAHERAHVPSMQGFLHWLEAGTFEVKRDLETGRADRVRVLTVHGSKGLQAPIVFLPDTTRAPAAEPKLFWADAPGGGDAAPVPLWSPRRGTDDPVAAAAREAAADRRDREYRRLLYVAMTRAEDRLYVAGWGKPEKSGGTWFAMVEDGLRDAGAREEADGRLVLDSPQRGAPDRAGARAAGPAPSPALPAWAAAPPPTEPRPPRPLAPSRMGDDPPPRSPFEAGGARRLRRGRIVHALLQTLPAVAPERRARAAEAYLARPAHGLDPAERAAVAAEVLRLVGDPAFAELFSDRALAEVPIVGRVGAGDGAAIVSGRIDRLLARADGVLAVDFKTGRAAPRDASDAPRPWLRQMAAYRALLREVYPGRPVRCALLWTDGPSWMELPDALLDAAAPAAPAARPLTGGAPVPRFRAFDGTPQPLRERPPCPPSRSPTTASAPMSCRPGNPCWSISGPSGAGRARSSRPRWRRSPPRWATA